MSRRSRPLKSEDESSSERMKSRRSQTPSRTSPAVTRRSPAVKSTSNRTPLQSRVQSAPVTRGVHSDPSKTRTKKMTSSERTYRSGQGSRESSQDRTADMSIYRKSSADLYSDRLTLDDLEVRNCTRNDVELSKRPASASANAFENLSVSLNMGKLTPTSHKSSIKPRQETRPGSSRSRIPIPVGRMNRSPSPFFSNDSPERADSGIEIYNEFETSPTNTLRRNNDRRNRPPDIIE